MLQYSLTNQLSHNRSINVDIPGGINVLRSDALVLMYCRKNEEYVICSANNIRKLIFDVLLYRWNNMVITGCPSSNIDHYLHIKKLIGYNFVIADETSIPYIADITMLRKGYYSDDRLRDIGSCLGVVILEKHLRTNVKRNKLCRRLCKILGEKQGRKLIDTNRLRDGTYEIRDIMIFLDTLGIDYPYDINIPYYSRVLEDTLKL